MLESVLFHPLSLLILILGLLFFIRFGPRRPKEPGFEYIFVEENGVARELDSDEIEYLNTPFHGGDGARPYIKSHYAELTPSDSIAGYLWRRKLPNGLPVVSLKPTENEYADARTATVRIAARAKTATKCWGKLVSYTLTSLVVFLFLLLVFTVVMNSRL